MKQLLILSVVCCALFLGGCKEDDSAYPDAVTEFIGLQTDESGTAVRLVADDGETYSINRRSGLNGLKTDTLYRTVSVFVPSTADGSADLYSCSLVLSLNPLPAQSFGQGIKSDAVKKIQSMWKSGDYINMILQVMVKDKSHSYHFIDEGIAQSEDGTQTLSLRLFHDSNNDYHAYSRRVYLSVPLSKYAGILKTGDKIRFALNIEDQGEAWREFSY